LPLTHIKAAIGNYRYASNDWAQPENNGDNTYTVRFMGTIQVPAPGDGWETLVDTDWFDIGLEMTAEPSDMGISANVEGSKFTQPLVRCVAIEWVNMPGPKQPSPFYWAVLHDIVIEAGGTKYAVCQLTDDAANKGKPEFLYAPESFCKLRGGHWAAENVPGCQRCNHVPIGAATGPSALSLARRLLIASLKFTKTKSYKYTGILLGTPELAVTIDVDEDGDLTTDYSGVIKDYSYTVRGMGYGEVTASLIDTSAEVLE
jgi:hypothetical protein